MNNTYREKLHSIADSIFCHFMPLFEVLVNWVWMGSPLQINTKKKGCSIGICFHSSWLNIRFLLFQNLSRKSFEFEIRFLSPENIVLQRFKVSHDTYCSKNNCKYIPYTLYWYKWLPFLTYFLFNFIGWYFSPLKIYNYSL